MAQIGGAWPRQDSSRNTGMHLRFQPSGGLAVNRP